MAWAISDIFTVTNFSIALLAALAASLSASGVPGAAFSNMLIIDGFASFFRALPPPPQPDAYIAEVIGLQYVGDGPNWVVVDLAAHGHIRVQSHHVTES